MIKTLYWPDHGWLVSSRTEPILVFDFPTSPSTARLSRVLGKRACPSIHRVLCFVDRGTVSVLIMLSDFKGYHDQRGILSWPLGQKGQGQDFFISSLFFSCSLVKLDPILSDCVLEKSEQHTVVKLPWDSLLTR